MACIFNMSIVSPGCKLFAAGLIGEQWKEKKRKEEKNWRFLLFMTCEEDKERKEITICIISSIANVGYFS